MPGRTFPNSDYALPSDKDLDYEDGLRHAHDYLTGRAAANPFIGRPGVKDLENAKALAGAPSAPAGSSPWGQAPNIQRVGKTATPDRTTSSPLYTPPAPPTSQADPAAPLIDEKVRKSQGVSAADWNASRDTQRPFDSDFFKPASERLADMQDAQNQRVEAGRNVVKSILQNRAGSSDDQGNETTSSTRLPNVTPAGPTPPVGGTQAVSINAPNQVKVGQSGVLTPGVDSSGRQVNMLNTPYSPNGGGTTTFDKTLGTRKPFIAGADQQNVARDFIAGGKYSSAAAGTDKTLDQGYVGALPRTRLQTAASTNVSRIFGG